MSAAVAERIPPHNIEAEQAVLGAMLLDNDVVADVVELLGRSDEMFYSGANRHIYAAMVALIEKSQPIDEIAVANQLREDGHYEAAGGMAYLGEIGGAVPQSANAAYYAGIVRHCHVLREVNRTCTRLASESLDPETAANPEWLDKAHGRLLGLFERRERHYPRPADETVSAAIVEIEAAVVGQPRNAGWSTGYPALDAIHGGFLPNLYIYASRPSIGKTTLAANIACHVAAAGNPVLFFALEMSGIQMAKKILMFRAGVNWNQIRAGFNARGQLDKARFAAPAIAKWPLWIDDTPNLTPNALRAKLRKHVHAHGHSLIVIDYLQLMEVPQQKGENRYQALGAVSRMLKNVSRELECPVIGLSQLGREADGVDPRISHLRETGNFEQDADAIVLLSRYGKPEIDDMHKRGQHLNLDFATIVKANVAKNREGETGVVQMVFDKPMQQFRDVGQQEPQYEETQEREATAPEPEGELF